MQEPCVSQDILFFVMSDSLVKNQAINMQKFFQQLLYMQGNKMNAEDKSKPVRKENQPSVIPMFIGRTDAEAEAPVLQPPDAKSRLIRKDPDTGKD